MFYKIKTSDGKIGYVMYGKNIKVTESALDK